MGQLIYYLKQIVMFPVVLIKSPGQLSAIFDDSQRSRALILGLPAILIAVFGVTALSWASYGLKPKLENRYRTAAESSNRDKKKVLQDLTTEMRMLQAANQSSGSTEEDRFSGIPEDDERRVKLRELQECERVYLEKLISLNPDDQDYRFQLGLVSLEQRDFPRGMALIQTAAPADEPGYAPAHLWLSRYYSGLRPESENQAKAFRNLALKHADHCLTRQQDNLPAKLIKARLLFANMRFEQAYQIFEDLYEEDPIFYEWLADINKRLNREQRNESIFQSALERFDEKLKDEELGDEAWVQSWKHIVKCHVEQNQFEAIETRLMEEIQAQSTTEEGSPKRVFAEQMLSAVYLDWIRWMMSQPEAEENPDDFRAREFEFLKLAYRYHPTNSNVLRGLARMAISSHPVAEEARKIYDPTKHADAPAAVLNELGTDALSKSRYEDAIRYFEMARNKAPSSSMILNNLAYTYLVCENRNPERALKLVDEAIRFLPNNESTRKVRTHFYDTRGTALMQLNRMTEAAAAFEMALQGRPYNRKILESLVTCYEGNNLSPEIYVRRLAELDRQEAETEDSANQE